MLGAPSLGCAPHRLRGCATRPAAADFRVSIFQFRAVGVLCSATMDAKNKLYFGDNLGILRTHVPDASVDLIYLDPPFNSSATYNVLFKEKSGEESAAQIMASEDTWQWSAELEAAYKESSPPPRRPTMQQVGLAPDREVANANRH